MIFHELRERLKEGETLMSRKSDIALMLEHTLHRVPDPEEINDIWLARGNVIGVEWIEQ